MFGATQYVWGAPTGSTVATGQNTNASTINFGAAAGNITCIAKNACGSRGSTSFAVAMPCKMHDSLNGLDISVSPNPASDKTILSISGTINDNCTYSVIDMLGKNKMKGLVDTAVGKEFELDIQALPAGVYFVEVSDGTDVRTVRLVKE
jgi:hypothetical protein